MIQLSGFYTVGGLMMMLFLSACAATGGKGAEGPAPSVRDNLATDTVALNGSPARGGDDEIPTAG